LSFEAFPTEQALKLFTLTFMSSSSISYAHSFCTFWA
jgi:hypothetical protein